MQPVVWIERRVLDACYSDADRYFPAESGGAFLGYETDDTLVITAMILGGEKALRTKLSFAPDSVWQNARIAEYYEQSGRLETYLGDWHSHPDTQCAYLSGDDRSVMKMIIKSPDARATSPLMCVLVGTKSKWKMHGWRGSLRPRRFWPDGIELTPMTVLTFDD